MFLLALLQEIIHLMQSLHFFVLQYKKVHQETQVIGSDCRAQVVNRQKQLDACQK